MNADYIVVDNGSLAILLFKYIHGNIKAIAFCTEKHRSRECGGRTGQAIPNTILENYS